MNRKSARIAQIALTIIAAIIPIHGFAATVVDHAGNAPYADGWQMGDNGGSGFEPWVFAFSGDAGTLMHPAPQFIDTPPALSGNSLGAPAFALTTSDRPSFFDTSEATRALLVPLAIGETFHLDVDGSAFDPIADAFSIGNTVQLFGSDGMERWAMFTNNGYQNDHWTATDNVDTGIPAGDAFHIAFTLISANTFDLVLGPIGGGAPLFSQDGATLSGTADVAISSLRVSAYGTGSSADGSKELFFNNIRIVPEPDAGVLCAWSLVGLLGLARRSGRRKLGAHCLETIPAAPAA